MAEPETRGNLQRMIRESTAGGVDAGQEGASDQPGEEHPTEVSQGSARESLSSVEQLPEDGYTPMDTPEEDQMWQAGLRSKREASMTPEDPTARRGSSPIPIPSPTPSSTSAHSPVPGIVTPPTPEYMTEKQVLIMITRARDQMHGFIRAHIEGLEHTGGSVHRLAGELERLHRVVQGAAFVAARGTMPAMEPLAKTLLAMEGEVSKCASMAEDQGDIIDALEYAVSGLEQTTLRQEAP